MVIGVSARIAKLPIRGSMRAGNGITSTEEGTVAANTGNVTAKQAVATAANALIFPRTINTLNNRPGSGHHSGV